MSLAFVALVFDEPALRTSDSKIWTLKNEIEPIDWIRIDHKIPSKSCDWQKGKLATKK